MKISYGEFINGGRRFPDSDGVLRGKREGISSYYQNWKGYYGEEAYNNFVKEKIEKRRKAVIKFCCISWLS